MKRMRAKFAGTCRRCGGRIHQGQEIQWSRATGAMHDLQRICTQGQVEMMTEAEHDHRYGESALARIESQGERRYTVGGASDAAHARGHGDWFDDEFDAEAEMIRREEAEYLRGYHEVAAIQAMSAPGSDLREQMYREMEMAAYNRGEDY